MELKYEWYCKRDNTGTSSPKESFLEDLQASPPISMPTGVPDVATTNKSLPRDHFSGCFGTGVGRLNGAGKYMHILYEA